MAKTEVAQGAPAYSIEFPGKPSAAVLALIHALSGFAFNRKTKVWYISATEEQYNAILTQDAADRKEAARSERAGAPKAGAINVAQFSGMSVAQVKALQKVGFTNEQIVALAGAKA